MLSRNIDNRFKAGFIIRVRQSEMLYEYVCIHNVCSWLYVDIRYALLWLIRPYVNLFSQLAIIVIKVYWMTFVGTSNLCRRYKILCKCFALLFLGPAPPTRSISNCMSDYNLSRFVGWLIWFTRYMYSTLWNCVLMPINHCAPRWI